jgi:hypothetical protein
LTFSVPDEGYSGNISRIFIACRFLVMNKSLDFKLSAHDALMDYPSTGTLKIERIGSQIIKKCFGAIQPKGLNRIANVG